MEKEPVLMPFQDQPFNGDTFVCSEFLKLKEKFLITTAIETGSCLFSTTAWLANNFEEVHTVEINEDFAKHGRWKIADKKNVFSKIGDSVHFLNVLLGEEQGRCIFFLDAHWNSFCPLLDELTAISNINTEMKPPIIVIHDFKVPDEPNLGFDSIHGQPFEFEWIKPYVDAIYGEGNYDYYYNSDATSTEIKRGVIYITPST